MKNWYVIFFIVIVLFASSMLFMGMAIPENSTEKLQHVSTFSTSFSTSTEARKHNIKQATSNFDWIVVQPGEAVSFNDIVGPRTIKNGYKESIVISNGEYVEGVGGGVCQVSTTLYNAWIRADLAVEYVRSHSLPASYVDLSMDATVSSDIDLILVNNSNSNAMINGYVKDSKVIFDIYARPLDYEVKVISKVIKVIYPKAPEIININSFGEQAVHEKEGREYIVLKREKVGYHSALYIQYLQDGKVASQKKVREDWYNPISGKIGVLVVQSLL